MIYRYLFALLFIIVFVSVTRAQFVIVPLESNPVIENYIKNDNGNLRSVRTNDTLILPFFDDFSKNLIYPDASLWVDSDVFINQSFGNNPPSIGVATFDALDATGRIQSNASSQGFVSDYLTSEPIDLRNYSDSNPISISTAQLLYYETATGIYRPADSLLYEANSIVKNCKSDSTIYFAGMRIYYRIINYFNEVTDSLYYFNPVTGDTEHIELIVQYNYSPADSLYLSFYYQPQGITLNEPEPEDSLVLDFKNESGNWIQIWSQSGSSMIPFKRVMIPVSDSAYLYKGFQFRFKNYASIGENVVGQQSFIGNVDSWNIDYVYLNKKRSLIDTVPDDVTFVNNFYSFLKEYVSVPWNHFKGIPDLQIDTVRFLYRNLSDSIKNVQRRYKVTNITKDSLILNNSLGNENSLPHTDINYFFTETANYFPPTTDSNATFEVQVNINAGTSITNERYYWNDSIKFYQKFSNYYAYDDGTPEYGAGIAGKNTQNGKVAFKFTPLKPDTLRGVYMFFNRTQNDANQKYFYLAVWNSSNGLPSDLIYKMEGPRPEFDGFNQFHYYSLDTSIYISNTFFVGWIQTTEDLLNIGLDMNYDASDKTFYNIYGNWESMPVNGTLMIRPVLSTEPFVNISETVINKKIKIYPNPASDLIYIEAPDNFSFNIFTITGLKILENREGDKTVNVSQLPSGLYFIRGTDGRDNFTGKIIINR